MSQHDNILSSDGNVTIVNGDAKGKTTHKNEVSQHDNIQSSDGKVTIENDAENGQTAHKDKVSKLQKQKEDKYQAPMRKPTKAEERSMISKAVEVLIISCMTNHVYKFNNTI